MNEDKTQSLIVSLRNTENENESQNVKIVDKVLGKFSWGSHVGLVCSDFIGSYTS